MKIERCNPTLAITALAVGLVAGANVVCAQIPCEYDVQIIQGPWCGDIFEYPPTFPTDINEAGHVIGYYWPCDIGPATPFRWTPEQGFVTLPMPSGAQEAWPWGLNDQGDIVGTFENADNDFRAFVLADEQYTELPPVAQGGWSEAFAITNARAVVGYRSLGDDIIPHNAFLWENGDFLDLGVFDGPNSQARDVNHTLKTVGFTGTILEPIAFLWDNGHVLILGPIPTGITSFATAINDENQVVGGGNMASSESSGILSQPFLWQDGRWHLLGLLPSCDRGGARDVNNEGQIVGACGNSREPSYVRAFVWHNQSMFDLNELVIDDASVVIERAKSINDQGQIIADGSHVSGNRVGVLLTPIQAPVGDLDTDCRVGASDLLILLSQWGPCQDCSADLNGDGVVAAADLIILLSNWG